MTRGDAWMRKHKAALFVTFYDDSRTVEWYVEAENVAGRWELLSDDSSTSWSTILDGAAELTAWLKATMAGGSSSTPSTS
jgi:hypothetical protein